MPGKMRSHKEIAEEAREAMSRQSTHLLIGSKKLKEHLCSSISAVGSLFQIWDINGDGLITPSEFQQAVGALGVGVSPQVCDAVFQDFDPDGSGTVSYTEFLRFALRDKLANSATRVMDFFQSVDADGSGEVNVDEFRQAILMLGFDFPREHVDAIFSTMDADGSGLLSFKELHKQLRQGASVKLSKKLRVGGAGQVRLTTKERFAVDKYDPAYRSHMGATAPPRAHRPVTAPVPGALDSLPPQLGALMQAPPMTAGPLSATAPLPALGGLSASSITPHSILTINDANEFRLSIRNPGRGVPSSSQRLGVWPGGGGGPRRPEGRYRGFAARGLVVCDEKRRRTIMDEQCEIARQRLTGPELVFTRKMVPSYSGPRWTEPLPGIDQDSGRPLLCMSATTRSSNN